MVMLMVEPFIGLLVFFVFYYLKPQVFVPGLMGMQIALITGGAALASMVTKLTIERRHASFAKAPQDYLMWWLFAAILISHLAHMQPSKALAAGYSFLNVMVLYFLITNLVTDTRRLRIVLHVLAAMTLVLAIQGIIQYFTGTGLGGTTAMTEMENLRIRAMGQFGNPNGLAMALVVVIPVYILEFARSKMYTKLYVIVALALILFALYLTNSRGGVVAFGGVATMMFAMRYGIMRGAVFACMMVVVVIMFGPSRIETISTAEPSALGRIVAWDKGLDMLKAYPLFGVGAGAWLERYSKIVAHNSFIHCAAELGFFGLVPWVLMIYVSMKNAWFVWRKADPSVSGGLKKCSLMIFYAFLGHLLVVLFISKPYTVLLYILIGLSAAAVNIFVAKRDEPYTLFERKDLVAALCIIVLTLLAFKAFSSKVLGG
jgi:O-antigen ligase